MPADLVIINADDYGINPQVNQAILDAWAQGAIGDSSMMATTPNLPALIARAREAGLPAGIHLNMTNGRPLSDPAELPAFMTPEGTFINHREWTPPLPIEQIRLEFRRQVERVLALGWQPTHLDSHHYIHLYPEVLAVKLELARELGVPLRSVHDETRETIRAAGMVTTDHCTVEFSGDGANVETLIRLVEECPGGSLEIVTHPTYYEPDSMGSAWEPRQRELEALTSPEWRRYREEHGIRVAGFTELHA
ncbi:MAG: carbohydrate deacetylase [Armatimonadota bacterium]